MVCTQVDPGSMENAKNMKKNFWENGMYNAENRNETRLTTKVTLTKTELVKY